MKLSFRTKLWLLLTIGLVSGWFVDRSILSGGGYGRLPARAIAGVEYLVLGDVEWVKAGDVEWLNAEQPVAAQQLPGDETFAD